jgi:hypothetical protein
VIPEPNFPVQPVESMGRRPQVDAFRHTLKQGFATGRTPSVAVLGDWGIGKSSLLMKYAAVCVEPELNMLPVPFSVSEELGDYRRFAELLVDTFGACLARSQPIQLRVRREAQNWKLNHINVGPLALQRETPQLFLTSGTAILRHAIQDAWRWFIDPAQLNGVMFFLDDLHNLRTPSQYAVALALRDQFQSFGVENINCSVCFSAPPNYFSHIRTLAEPAVRFYDKVYLAPFSLAETVEYVGATSTAKRTMPNSVNGCSKTGGHPYFMAFICRQLARLTGEDGKLEAARHWEEIFGRLEKEKFSTDLAQMTDREVQLLRSLARSEDQEVGIKQFSEYERVYFSRLTDKGLLTRIGRGQYRLYHPLFREFLQQTK